MCKIVDLSIPQDAGVEQSQDEKFKRCEDAAREIRRIWLVKGKVIPFGRPWKHTKGLKSKFGVDVGIDVLQESVLFGMATILRKVIES